MSPRTRQALIVAVAAVGITAIAGIAAIQGWLPAWLSGESPEGAAAAPRIAGTAPPESLSPGESVVTPESAATRIAPADAPPEPAPAPHRTCPHCGTISSTTFHEREPRNARYEVRVRFDDGSRKTLRYPTDPGLRVGDRVSMTQGRLRKD